MSRHDHLGKRLAGGRIEQAALVIDLHRRLDQAIVDIGGRGVLHVTQTHRQRHAGRIALGLSGDVEIDCALQSFARAGNLREAGRQGQATRL